MSSSQPATTGQSTKAGTTQSRVVTTARNIKAAITQNFKAVTTHGRGVTAQNKAATTQNSCTAGTSQNNQTVTTQNISAAAATQNNNPALTSQNNNPAVISQNNNPAVTNQNNSTSGSNQNSNTAQTTQNNNTVTSQNNNIGTTLNTKTVSALITSTTTQVTNTTTQNMTDNDKAKAEKKGPSKLQLEKWTSSINSLLSDSDGIKYFRQFLEDKETDDEKGELTKYIDFYVECEQYKSKFKHLEEQAFKIYEKYLAVGADQELPAGDGCADIGDKLDEDGLEGVTLFDEPQKTIKKTIADGLYVDFCLNIKDKLKL